MRILRWLIALFTVTAFFAWVISDASAAGGTQMAPDLGIAIATAQSEAVEGSLVLWQVSLTNMSETPVTQVEIQPAGQAWFWPDGAKSIGSLPAQDSVVVEIPAVPLKAGPLRPILQVQYVVEDAHCSVSATASHPVSIVPVSTMVGAEVTSRQTTARVGQPLSMEVWITNRSPFTLTDVSLWGVGADMEWGKTTAALDVPPDTTSSIILTPTVRGKNPQAILSLEYHWTNATGQRLSEKRILQSNPFAVEKTFLSQVPLSTITALIGSLLALVPWSINVLYERRQRERVNRERVQGMLHMITVRATHGAEEGVAISLDLMEQLFSEEGLYAALEQLDGRLRDRNLVLCVQELWEAAQSHNAGIKYRGGAARTTDLKSKAMLLSDCLREIKRQSTNETKRHLNEKYN